MIATAIDTPKNGQSIRFRMATVFLVLALPMLLLSVHLALERRAAEAIAIEERALAIAKALALHPAQTIRQARVQMDAFAAQVSGLDASDCTATLQRTLALKPLLQAVAMVNEVGDVTCPVRPTKANFADREYFKRTLSERKFQVSGVLHGRTTGTWMIVLSQPFEQGALLAGLNLGWFQDMVNALPLADGALVSIVDGVGRIVARRPHVADYVGREIQDAASFRRQLESGQAGAHQVQTLDGTRRVVAFAKVPDAELYVRVGVPVAHANRAAWLVFAEVFLASLLLLGLATGLGWAAFRRLIAGPVLTLTQAALRLGHGDLAARTGIRPDTPVVGGLAEKFDELAAHGQRVTRALRTLSAGNRTLLRERDEQALLEAMCKVAVETGGYAAAYVCYARHDEGKSIEVRATAGADRGFLTSVNMTWEDTPQGRGSVGRCLRTGERTIVRSILDDPGAALWHPAARAHGFRSIISLPLRVNAALVGTFTLAAREEGAFDEDEVALLDEMAADLSFGIEVIRGESRRREAEDIARRALSRDSIVDVRSRAAFVARVNECIARGRKNHEPVAVLDIHLGRLQDVFDSFGYEHGTSVLRQVAELLKQVSGQEDDIGRLPVDDFGLTLCGHDANDAASSARRIREALDRPVRIGDALIDLQFAIGVSFFPGHGEEGEALVRRASIAARDAFRRELPYLLYAGATARENPQRLALAADLRAAIETRGLLLHYQPKVRLADGVQTGGEALLRWPHPTRGMVPPGEFVALAEDIGQMRALTNEVIDLAVRQQHAWGDAALPLAINLSVRNLRDPQFLPTLDGMIGTWGLRRELLHFEITESSLMDDPEAARRVLMELRDRGSKIYIDDFGTGYSSLSYLVRLPVHALKIDRSFVLQMTKSERAQALVASVISMAHTLGVSVVAEGVETAADAEMLRAMGCDEAQGYYFSRPLPADEYARWQADRP